MRGDKRMSFHEEKITATNATIAAGSTAIYGLTLNEWVLAATLVYFLLQIGLLVPKYITMFQDWMKDKKRNEPTN